MENWFSIVTDKCFRKSIVGSIAALAVLLIAAGCCHAAVHQVKGEQEVRSLPGSLDKVLVFNSNSPEVVLREGVLLSTMPRVGKRHPEAHLNHALSGRFDVFAHHIADGKKSGHMEDLYLGLIVHNPTSADVRLEIIQAASYLSQPDAPFVRLDRLLDNQDGSVYAGPGDRVATEILRGESQAGWKKTAVVPAGETLVLTKKAIPVANLEPPLNGRSLLVRMRSSGAVHLATVAKFSTLNEQGKLVPPSDKQLIDIVTTGNLVSPRDVAPTPPAQKRGLRYGRVAGVSIGAAWTGTATDADKTYLSVPPLGDSISFPIATVAGGTFGTGQIQSAPLAVRYKDTAYAAHGNYCVEYKLSLPLRNTSSKSASVGIYFESPLKTDAREESLRFLEPVSDRTFFRGTVRVKGASERSSEYHHLVLHKGESGPRISEIKLQPGDTRTIEISLIYPPDCTPPQVISVRAASYP